MFTTSITLLVFIVWNIVGAYDLTMAPLTNQIHHSVVANFMKATILCKYTTSIFNSVVFLRTYNTSS